MGRSTASGHRTRLFLDERDALAEERWLDRAWQSLSDFWISRGIMTDEDLRKRLAELLSMLAYDARIGMRRVNLTEFGERFAGLSVYRSNDPRDVDNIFIFLKAAANNLGGARLVNAPTPALLMAELERYRAEFSNFLRPSS